MEWFRRHTAPTSACLLFAHMGKLPSALPPTCKKVMQPRQRIRALAAQYALSLAAYFAAILKLILCAAREMEHLFKTE